MHRDEVLLECFHLRAEQQRHQVMVRVNYQSLRDELSLTSVLVLVRPFCHRDDRHLDRLDVHHLVRHLDDRHLGLPDQKMSERHFDWAHLLKMCIRRRLDVKMMGNRNQIEMEASCPLVGAFLELLAHQDGQVLLALDEVVV
jgi:hypothetical protein